MVEVVIDDIKKYIEEIGLKQKYIAKIMAIGIICTVVFAAIYAGVEAYVDANRKIETIARNDDDKDSNPDEEVKADGNEEDY